MRKLLLLPALLALSTGVARAGPAPRTHDGFFLQLDAGGGAFSTDADDDSLKLSGGGYEFSVGLGGALSESFLLGGQLWFASASDPDVETPLGNGTLDGSVNLVGVGPSLTYYFMPVNLYLQATPSFTRVTIDGPGDSDGSTEGGFGLRLAVGKEWFVGDNFGLGLNVHAAFASNKDKDDGSGSPPTFASRWYGLALSATFQ